MLACIAEGVLALPVLLLAVEVAFFADMTTDRRKLSKHRKQPCSGELLLCSWGAVWVEEEWAATLAETGEAGGRAEMLSEPVAAAPGKMPPETAPSFIPN